MVLDLVFSSS